MSKHRHIPHDPDSMQTVCEVCGKELDLRPKGRKALDNGSPSVVVPPGNRVYRVFGERYYFCTTGCRDAFRSDKKLGLMYGQVKMSDDRIVGWAEASRELNRCAYCLGQSTPINQQGA